MRVAIPSLVQCCLYLHEQGKYPYQTMYIESVPKLFWLLEWRSSRLHQYYWLFQLCTIGCLSDCSTNLCYTQHFWFSLSVWEIDLISIRMLFSPMHGFSQKVTVTFPIKNVYRFSCWNFWVFTGQLSNTIPSFFLFYAWSSQPVFDNCCELSNWFSCCFSKRWDPSTSSYSWLAYSINDAIPSLQSQRLTLSCSWKMRQFILFIFFSSFSIPILN